MSILDPVEAIADGFWRTVCAALCIVIGLVGIFAGVQTLRLSWMQTDAAMYESNITNATNANKAQEAMLTAMTAQRDGLLLARAADAKAVEETLTEAGELLAMQNAALQKQRQTIRDLARQASCHKVMQMAVCPEIVKELRAP